jgi:hypothetical protein
MNDTMEPFRYHIDKGELKVPAWMTAVRKEISGMTLLDAARAVVSPGFWISLANRTPDLLQSLIDVPLADTLVGAWKTHKKFSKFKKGQFPADKISVLPLSTHHIKASRSPYIELFLDGKSAGKIPFQLALDITVDEGVVVIQDGMIKRLEAGKAKVVGTLKCAGEVVAEQASGEFTLPKGISFGQGIAITAV